MKNLLTDDGQIVCLIKPQFEAGREKVGKHGVVRDKAVHIEVIEMVINYAISIGFEILNLEFSLIITKLPSKLSVSYINRIYDM